LVRDLPSYSFFDFLEEIIAIAGKELVTFHTTVKDKTKAYVEAVTRTETLDATSFNNRGDRLF